ARATALRLSASHTAVKTRRSSSVTLRFAHGRASSSDRLLKAFRILLVLTKRTSQGHPGTQEAAMPATTPARRQVFRSYETADADAVRAPLHCAHCGLTCRPCRDGERTRPVCPGCGWVAYRNPAPGVAVLVTDGDRVLLGRRAGRTRGGGLWELPGGFVEFDEDFLFAGRREVREEAGLDVEITGIVSVTSNFFSPALHSLVIVLTASPVGGVLRAGDGFDAVRWVPKAGPFPPLAADADTDFLQMLAAGLPPSLPVDPRYAGPGHRPPPEPGGAPPPPPQLAHLPRAAGGAGLAHRPVGAPHTLPH